METTTQAQVVQLQQQVQLLTTQMTSSFSIVLEQSHDLAAQNSRIMAALTSLQTSHSQLLQSLKPSTTTTTAAATATASSPPAVSPSDSPPPPHRTGSRPVSMIVLREKLFHTGFLPLNYFPLPELQFLIKKNLPYPVVTMETDRG